MRSRDTIALVETDSAMLELCRIVEEPDGGAPSLCTLVRPGLSPLTLGIPTYYSHCIRERVPAYDKGYGREKGLCKTKASEKVKGGAKWIRFSSRCWAFLTKYKYTNLIIVQ